MAHEEDVAVNKVEGSASQMPPAGRALAWLRRSADRRSCHVSPPEIDRIIDLVSTPESMAEGSEPLVLVTEWPEVKNLDLAHFRSLMKEGLVLDGQNFLTPEQARAAGSIYVGVGLYP